MILLHNFGGGSGLKDTGSLNVELATTSYIHGQPFSTQGATVIYTPPIGDPVDVTAAVTFEPANGETLQQDGQVMVRAIYTSGEDTIYGSAYVNVTPVPQSLSVQLHDTGMKAGDAVSYAGAQVTCLYTDLSTRDISNENITWSPPAGTIQNSDGVLTVTASYAENGTTATGTAEIVVTNKVLTALAFTLPQTTYDYGDKIKYTDAVVTVTYNDGSTRIVTNLAEYDPVKNEVLTESTVAQVSYTENSVTKVAGVPITVTPGVDSMKIEWPDAGFSIGSTLDYSGATVTATLTDGTKKDVTEEVTWLPQPGTALTRSQDLTCTALYVSNGKEHEASIEIFVSESKVKSLGASLKKTRFLSGDEFTTSGATATALYENGTTRDVSDRVTWTPASGDILDPTITKAIAKYEENNVVVTASVDINVAAISTLSVSTNKTQWIVGDSLNAADFVVTLEYADGTTKDVSSAVTFTPADGATLSEGTLPVKITYTEGSRVYEKVVPITVVNVPVSIEAEHAITTYTVGSSLDYSNDVYIVTMADGTELELSYQQVTNKPSQNSVLDTIGTQLIASSYTKNGVTVTVRSSVSVEADPNSETSASGQIQTQQEKESADVARSAGYSVKDSDDGESGGESGGGSGGGGTSGGGNSYMSSYTAPAATAYSAPSGSSGGGSGFVSVPTGSGKETALFVPDTDSKVNADGTVTVSSTDRHASVLGTITDNDGNKYSIDSSGNVTCTDSQGNVTTRTLDEYGSFIGLSGNDLQIITDGNDNVTGAKESVSTTYTPDENGEFTDKYGNDMKVNEDGTVSATSTSTSRNEGSYFTAADGNTYLVSDDGTSIAKITPTGVEEVPLDENNSFEVNGTTYTLNSDGTVTSTTGEGGESSTVDTAAGSVYTAPDGTQYLINSDGTVTSVDGVIMDSAYVGTLIDEDGNTYVLDGNAESILDQLENNGSVLVQYDLANPENAGETVTIISFQEYASASGGAHNYTYYECVDTSGNKIDSSALFYIQNGIRSFYPPGIIRIHYSDKEGEDGWYESHRWGSPPWPLENGVVVEGSVSSRVAGVAPAINSSMEPEVITRPTLAEALSGYHGLSPQETAASNWADGSTSWGGLNYLPTTTTSGGAGGGGSSF